MNTVTHISSDADRTHHCYIWTLSPVQPLTRENKVSSSPFWVALSLPSPTVTKSADDVKHHPMPAGKPQETTHFSPSLSSSGAEVPSGVLRQKDTSSPSAQSSFVEKGSAVREFGHKMKLTIAKGIIPAPTEEEDAIGVVVDWMRPPPLPSGSPTSRTFPPPGLTTITVSLLSPLPPSDGPVPTTHPSGHGCSIHAVNTTAEQQEKGPQDTGRSAPPPSSCSLQEGGGAASHVDACTILTSDSISVYFAEDGERRVALPYFFSPVLWRRLCQQGQQKPPYPPTTTSTSGSAAPWDATSPASLRLQLEIAFGGMAAASALLRPVTETVTSMWSAFSSHLSSWVIAPTTTTSSSSSIPSAIPTEMRHSMGELLQRVDLTPSAVVPNAEVVQERVASMISSATAALSSLGGYGDETAPLNAKHDEKEADDAPHTSPLSPSSLATKGSSTAAEERVSTLRPWCPPPPPQWADRKEYWEHLVVERLGGDPLTYLTRPADLSTLTDTGLLESLENFGFTIDTLVELFPDPSRPLVRSTGAGNSAALPVVKWGAEEYPSSRSSAHVGEEDGNALRKRKFAELTEEERWRQWLWKCAALALCTIEEEVEIVLKVLNYDLLVSFRPSSSLVPAPTLPPPSLSSPTVSRDQGKEGTTEKEKMYAEKKDTSDVVQETVGPQLTAMTCSSSERGAAELTMTPVPTLTPSLEPLSTAISMQPTHALTTTCSSFVVSSDGPPVSSRMMEGEQVEWEAAQKARMEAVPPEGAQALHDEVTHHEKQPVSSGPSEGGVSKHCDLNTAVHEGEGSGTPLSSPPVHTSASGVPVAHEETEMEDQRDLSPRAYHEDPSTSMQKFRTAKGIAVLPDNSIAAGPPGHHATQKGATISEEENRATPSTMVMMDTPATHPVSTVDNGTGDSLVVGEEEKDKGGSNPLQDSAAASVIDVEDWRNRKEQLGSSVKEALTEELEFPQMPWEVEEEE